MKTKICFVVAAIALSGCTSIKVDPVSTEYKLSHVCIERNSKVQVKEFLPVVEDRLQYHGITTQVSDAVPQSCEYRLTYTALRSWDFTPYLSHAELRLYKGYKQIGYGEFHLNGKGGLALTKFDSVETKMIPVVDQMLGKSLQTNTN
ncbi:Sbal_3080 family lipoprotein [Photobacterium kagoshimensis]|uniref:Sbal_3080 family lipoprotein n=1 Tax=Photobacterium kagoshimensis TaxID=2910242 RepID=UPI003D0AC67F